MPRLHTQPHCCVPTPQHSWSTTTRRFDFAWMNGMTIPYWFLPDNYAERQAAVVRWAFTTWEACGIGIRFRKTLIEKEALIRIRFNFPNPPASAGALAATPPRARDMRTATRLGAEAVLYKREVLAATMEFAWDLRSEWGHATALHEVGHALGLGHEHQRLESLPVIDPGCAVRRFMDHDPARAGERAALESDVKDNVSDRHVVNLVSAYVESGADDWDVFSVMNYPIPERTIRSPAAYFKTGTPRNHELSPRDRQRIAEAYPKTLPVPSPLAPGIPMPIAVDFTGQADFAFTMATSGKVVLETRQGSGGFLSNDTLIALFRKNSSTDPLDITAIDWADESRSQRFATLVKDVAAGDYIAKVRVFDVYGPFPNGPGMDTGAEIVLTTIP